MYVVLYRQASLPFTSSTLPHLLMVPRVHFAANPPPHPSVIPSSLGPGPAFPSSPIPFVVTFKANHISVTLISPFLFLFLRLQTNSLLILKDLWKSFMVKATVGYFLLTPRACWRVLRTAPASRFPCFHWRKAIFTAHLEVPICSTQMTEGSHFFHVYTLH